jgi:hypothetical protein
VLFCAHANQPHEQQEHGSAHHRQVLHSVRIQRCQSFKTRKSDCFSHETEWATEAASCQGVV